MIKDNTT